ncbi:hypothetical protein NH340_JMT03372 [Sarcoptes scabiei]|nr:hypothetical protein NH340_JMT03372 [Sarcoptes scabiei]
MDFFRNLYEKIIEDLTQFNVEYDLNYTCNVFLSKNLTLIEIDRGWEGIPESLVINLILCSFLILPFVIFRYLARYRSNVKSSSRTNWVQFIYGNRNIKKKSIVSKNFQTIGTYFDQSDNFPTILPLHIHSCKNKRAKKRSSYGSSLTTTTIQPIHNNLSPSSSSGASSSMTISSTVTSKTQNVSNDRNNLLKPTMNVEHTNSINNSDDFVSPSDSSSQSNLVQSETETTFPTYQNSSISTRNEPIDFIKRLFTNLCNITDEKILLHKGQDAYHYLLFQRYIIIFLFLLSLVTIFIILPINIQGDNAFARTSISNISNDSQLFWSHAICSTIVIVLGVYLMHNFSNGLKTDVDLMHRKTLLIRRLPVIEDPLDKLEQYFSEKFPRVAISGIQFISDMSKLDALEKNYSNASNALRFCEEWNSSNENRFTIRPHNCNALNCCCNQIDGYEFYRNEKQNFKDKIYSELRKIPSRTIRSAFITFETEEMAKKVYSTVKKEQKHSFSLIRYFCDQNSIDLAKCMISYAPYPDDVNWRDVAFDINLLWLRKIFISIILFIIFFFLSTPALLLKIIDLIAIKDLIKTGIVRPSFHVDDVGYHFTINRNLCLPNDSLQNDLGFESCSDV